MFSSSVSMVRDGGYMLFSSSVSMVRDGGCMLCSRRALAWLGMVATCYVLVEH